MTIPVIDAAALTGGDEQQLAVFRAKLLDGLKTYGFVKLINHTVPVPLVAETFDQVCSVPRAFSTWYPQELTPAAADQKILQVAAQGKAGHRERPDPEPTEGMVHAGRGEDMVLGE